MTEAIDISPLASFQSAEHPRSLLVSALLLFSLVPGSAAPASLRVSAASIHGNGWSAHDLEVQADSDSGQLVGSAAAIDAGATVGQLESVQWRCDLFTEEQVAVGCENGSLQAEHPWLSGPISGVRAAVLAAGEGLSIDVAEASTLLGQLRLALLVRSDSLEAQLAGNELDAAGLVRLGSEFWPVDDGIEAHGQFALEATLRAGAASQHRIAADLGFSGLRLGDGTGLREAENLSGELSVGWQTVNPRNGRFEVAGTLQTGAAYLDPIYVEITPGKPWRWQSSGRLAAGRLTSSTVMLELGSTLALGAVGSLSLASPTQATLRLDVSSEDLATAFATFARPFLGGTAWADVSLGGRGNANLVLEQGRPTAMWAVLDAAQLDDPAGRLALEGLDADLQWASSGGPWPAHLSWQAGTFYRLPFGPSELELRVSPASATLQRAQPVPLLGGRIVAEALHAEHTREGTAWELSGRVTGVDLGELTQRLEWPALGGDLSGIIPSARYNHQRFQVGGAILVRAFDGSITITDLVLDRPLGPVPRLTANMDLANIDLKALTRAFSLGRIEGKLEGHVRDLELVNWRPTRFDAYLGTPEGDDSRHRISQRAVNEIASLGSAGAPVAALSRGVLSLFSEFSYRRLGVSCRLRANVCEMGGIAPAAQGYYLVQGSGLPQINVIGYARQVDWEDLIARLVAASESEGPVIGIEESQ